MYREEDSSTRRILGTCTYPRRTAEVTSILHACADSRRVRPYDPDLAPDPTSGDLKSFLSGERDVKRERYVYSQKGEDPPL